MALLSKMQKVPLIVGSGAALLTGSGPPIAGTNALRAEYREQEQYDHQRGDWGDDQGDDEGYDEEYMYEDDVDPRHQQTQQEGQQNGQTKAQPATQAHPESSVRAELESLWTEHSSEKQGKKSQELARREFSGAKAVHESLGLKKNPVSFYRWKAKAKGVKAAPTRTLLAFKAALKGDPFALHPDQFRFPEARLSSHQEREIYDETSAEQADSPPKSGKELADQAKVTVDCSSLRGLMGRDAVSATKWGKASAQRTLACAYLLQDLACCLGEAPAANVYDKKSVTLHQQAEVQQPEQAQQQQSGASEVQGSDEKGQSKVLFGQSTINGQLIEDGGIRWWKFWQPIALWWSANKPATVARELRHSAWLLAGELGAGHYSKLALRRLEALKLAWAAPLGPTASPEVVANARKYLKLSRKTGASWLMTLFWVTIAFPAFVLVLLLLICGTAVFARLSACLGCTKAKSAPGEGSQMSVFESITSMFQGSGEKGTGGVEKHHEREWLVSNGEADLDGGDAQQLPFDGYGYDAEEQGYGAEQGYDQGYAQGEGQGSYAEEGGYDADQLYPTTPGGTAHYAPASTLGVRGEVAPPPMPPPMPAMPQPPQRSSKEKKGPVSFLRNSKEKLSSVFGFGGNKTKNAKGAGKSASSGQHQHVQQGHGQWGEGHDHDHQGYDNGDGRVVDYDSDGNAYTVSEDDGSEGTTDASDYTTEDSDNGVPRW